MTNSTSTTKAPHGRLVRSQSDHMIAGVAGGAAEWLGVDTTVVRLGLVGLTLFGGIGIPLYLAAWLLLPEEDAETSIAEDLLARRSS